MSFPATERIWYLTWGKAPDRTIMFKISVSNKQGRMECKRTDVWDVGVARIGEGRTVHGG